MVPETGLLIDENKYNRSVEYTSKSEKKREISYIISELEKASQAFRDANVYSHKWKALFRVTLLLIVYIDDKAFLLQTICSALCFIVEGFHLYAERSKAKESINVVIKRARDNFEKEAFNAVSSKGHFIKTHESIPVKKCIESLEHRIYITYNEQIEQLAFSMLLSFVGSLCSLEGQRRLYYGLPPDESISGISCLIDCVGLILLLWEIFCLFCYSTLKSDVENFIDRLNYEAKSL